MTQPLTCQELVELITGYLENALPAAERSRFDEHLLECEGCTHYLSQMRGAIRLAGQLSEADLPEDIKGELLQLFRDWKAKKAG